MSQSEKAWCDAIRRAMTTINNNTADMNRNFTALESEIRHLSTGIHQGNEEKSFP